MGRKLYVGNLPYETNEDDLQNLFAQAGAVESVSVMRDRETGRARGFAFVEMVSDEDAQNAISQLNEQPFGGRRLTVTKQTMPARWRLRWRGAVRTTVRGEAISTSLRRRW